MEFLLGLIIGFIGCLTWAAIIGHRELSGNGTSGGNLYHPQPLCTDGHKWCEEHAKVGQFHCTKCHYVMTEQ